MHTTTMPGGSGRMLRRIATVLLCPGALAAGDADLGDAMRAHRLIAARCIACHGPERSDAGLRFDRPADLQLIVVPGRPELSRLLVITRLPPGDPLLMPPGGRLDGTELALLERWIAAGARPPASP